MANANDTFTGVDGTNLSAHTSDSGHTWTKRGTGANLLISANAIYADTSGAWETYYSSCVPAAADYDVQADVIVSSSGATSPLICARIDTGVNTAYAANFNGGSWFIHKIVNGTATSGLGSYAGDVPTTVKTAKLSLVGSTLKLYINGVLRITVTDTSISAAGRPGAGAWYANNTASNNLDNWSSVDAVAGGMLKFYDIDDLNGAMGGGLD